MNPSAPNTNTQGARPGPTEEADPVSQLEVKRAGRSKREEKK